MTTAAPGNIPAPPPGCPFNAEFLPPNLRKHVDPAAPVPLRMMAAKSLVPLSPSDMLGALFMLTFDADTAVRETAAKTSSGLPEKILGSALRDEEVQPQVLGYFLGLLKEKDAYAEMLVLNASTPDEAVAAVARDCGAKLAEIIGQNQLRLLRHEDILRNLCSNAQAPVSLIDGVCDFAVRSGMQLTDVPQMKAARVRLFGPEAAEAPPDPGPTAEQVLQEMGGEVSDENAAPLEEGKRLTLAQRLMKMSISEKIKLATLGNKEARGALIRDTNKLVAVAVIRSPRITDGEVLSCAANRAIMEDVLRVIYNNREWTKNMKVKLALVKNPKVPLTVTMKFLNVLRDNELKDLSRDKNVPAAVQQFAKKMLEKKTTPKRTDDK
ncbi:hypothetical protein MYSTI_03802 [Myxococcus stipitatus DSM 14675]|uniref:Leucine rich repeat variant n=1 Tax=Myxococcus stipitatus (strain DSM 14675 / JCM 12634 / Mx s8) TaxID=1278073 RepID=L7UAL2_MYXSD|nr:hypothetical protein [Myxococcus stipitatus]AGC45108.1 hypothetical protein MYSTI_03802 [Myxococcus stipitatus DSM 14675]